MVALNRFAWLERVMCDHNLSASAARLGGILALRYADKAGNAWPSQRRLAGDLGVDVRTVKRLAKELEARAHLKRAAGVARKSTVYSLANAPKVSKELQPPQPMLRTFSTIAGSKIAPPAPEHFADTWQLAQSQLQEQLNAKDYERWVRPLCVVSASADRVVIESAGVFERDRVVERYGDHIFKVLQALHPKIEAVDFRVAPKGARAA